LANATESNRKKSLKPLKNKIHINRPSAKETVKTPQTLPKSIPVKKDEREDNRIHMSMDFEPHTPMNNDAAPGKPSHPANTAPVNSANTSPVIPHPANTANTAPVNPSPANSAPAKNDAPADNHIHMSMDIEHPSPANSAPSKNAARREENLLTPEKKEDDKKKSSYENNNKKPSSNNKSYKKGKHRAVKSAKFLKLCSYVNTGSPPTCDGSGSCLLVENNRCFLTANGDSLIVSDVGKEVSVVYFPGSEDCTFNAGTTQVSLSKPLETCFADSDLSTLSWKISPFDSLERL